MTATIAPNVNTFRALARRDALTPPNGCCVCGIVERDHPWTYGFAHAYSNGRYDPPTDAQRLNRMYAARDMRINGNVHAAAERLWIRTLPDCRTCRMAPATHAGDCYSCFSLSLDLEKGYRIPRDRVVFIAPPSEPVFLEHFGDGIDVAVLHAVIDSLETTVCGIGDVKVRVDPVPAGALRCGCCFAPKGGAR